MWPPRRSGSRRAMPPWPARWPRVRSSPSTPCGRRTRRTRGCWSSASSSSLSASSPF
uniref:Uncharacterized protein n=1 Tax=Human herpesvirus 2 TaxID=10310 RepID=A0A481TPQ0_HHV2|nr:hypothetical protein [Human alphaherpesvirus 2]